MKTVCAWCGKWMRGLVGRGPVSHGICRQCARVAVEDDVWDLWLDVGGEG